MLGDAGFKNAEIVGETGFNSSPKTKGVLIRAHKLTRLIDFAQKKSPGKVTCRGYYKSLFVNLSSHFALCTSGKDDQASTEKKHGSGFRDGNT